MEAKDVLIDLIKDCMVRPTAVLTSAGDFTTTYLDIPGVLRDRRSLTIVTHVLFEHLAEHDYHRDATMVVGPMTGSIPLVMTLVNSGFGDPNFQWSIIRDEVKDHGLRRQFVGGEPGPGDKVILIDDVASSGQSLVEAYQTVIKTGAQVLAIAPLVDRGEDALNTLQDAGIYVPYLPVLTYKDLGIEAL